MSTQMQKSLDPRLRRLVRTRADTDRLAHDLARGVVSMAPEAGAEEPSAENVRKRVLAMLSSNQVPDRLPQYRWRKISDGIYAVELPVSEIETLAATPGVEYVEAGRELGPLLVSSVPATRANLVHNPTNGTPGFDGSDVIVGIVDFGLDFTLDDFRRPDGTTRVAFLWDQALNPNSNEHAPAGFGFGVEYDAAAINQALAAPDPFTIVRHRPAPSSHGTHVAGIAAGSGRSGDNTFPSGQFIGTAPGATIIFVQPEPTDQTTTFTDSVRVAEAVAYIYEKAEQLGRPCVVNMSLGQNGGSHDGESVVERAIDQLLAQPGRGMTLAAGNEHIWQGHASGQIAQGATRTLTWKMGFMAPFPVGGTLPPGLGDFTPNELEIWYSSRDRLSVRVIDPSGQSTSIVSPGGTVLETLPSGDQVFIDSERFAILNGDARIYIEVSPGSFLVSPGDWTVELTAIESRNGRFDAWIERDARRRDNRFRDQSFFVGADFDGVMTLGTPATPRRAVAVANFDHVVVTPSLSSSRGPTRDGRQKPEVAAPGTNILSSNSMGGRPDGNGGVHAMRVSMSGTSMAAPHVAGIIALMLQKRTDLTAPQIRSILITAGSAPAGVTPFDVAWGFGRVDARSAVDLVV
jgi:subtilisin family serine protease